MLAFWQLSLSLPTYPALKTRIAHTRDDIISLTEGLRLINGEKLHRHHSGSPDPATTELLSATAELIKNWGSGANPAPHASATTER